MDVKTDYTEFFQLKNRTDGTQFVCLIGQAPSELQDLIRKVHFDLFDNSLPNDWIYSVIHDALGDLLHDHRDDILIEPDCYYHDLYKWLGEPFAHGLCNEALDMGSCTDIYNIIGVAQCTAKEMIYDAVAEFLQEQKESNDE